MKELNKFMKQMLEKIILLLIFIKHSLRKKICFKYKFHPTFCHHETILISWIFYLKFQFPSNMNMIENVETGKEIDFWWSIMKNSQSDIGLMM